MMYKWNAEDYYKNSSQQQKWARELIKKLELKGNERILDIGCGDGKVTAEIAECVPNGSVLGIDSSEDMVKFAHSKFPISKFPNLSFQHGDASNLNFDNEFDVIVSFACLHWIINHIPVLEGIKRSLKASGRILLQFGGKGNIAAIASALHKVTSTERWKNYFHDFTLPLGFYGTEEYQDWLNQVGLKVTRVELVSKDMTQQGKAGLEGWIRTTGLPLTAKVPENLHQNFIEDLVNTYIESNPLDKEGFIHVPMVRLNIEATS